MKNMKWIIVAAMLFTGVGLAHAEGMKGGKMDKEQKGGMMGGDMMKSDMMDKGGMMGMHGMMMKMMDKSVVATSDGGIVVVFANKVSKYDKDLTLVKEIELKMPTMEEMQKMCPMMGKMMSAEGSKAEESKKSAADEKAEHKSHH